MKKALVEPSGRVAQVEHEVDVFWVAPPLVWVDCPDECVADLWVFFDGQCIPRPAPVLSAAEIIKAFTDAIQFRLDAFARTRNYDGILSAATYATSAVPKFQAEGQYAVQARDATWAAAYQILAEVQAGTRPMPGQPSDIFPELPELVWPV